jgi:hypothetical protein
MSDTTPFLGLIDSWQQRARTNQKAHYIVAERLHRRNYQFGVPVIILSAIVGTSVFATLAKDVGLWSRVAVGGVSIAVTVLSALQTFFRFTERAEQHRGAAIQYGILNRELERIHALPPSEQAEAQKVLLEVEQKFNDLAQHVPAIPGAVWSQIPHELTPARKE